MTQPRPGEILYGHNYHVAELEAPRHRPAEQVASQGPFAICELSAESSVSKAVDAENKDTAADGPSVPQANPWPFHLDDTPNTQPARDPRQGDGRGTTSWQQPANPWPYHGLETEKSGIGDDFNNNGNQGGSIHDESLHPADHMISPGQPRKNSVVLQSHHRDHPKLDSSKEGAAISQDTTGHPDDPISDVMAPTASMEGGVSLRTVLPVRQNSGNRQGNTTSGYSGKNIYEADSNKTDGK